METIVRLLAPFAPHVAEELWSVLGHQPGILKAGWPEVDESALERETVEIVVQVNGKVRSHITVPVGLGSAEVEKIALSDERVRKFIGSLTVRKVVVVPNRLVNIAVS